MDVAHLAEAGIELALARTAEACCSTLHDWSVRLTGAAAACVVHERGGQRLLVGSDPSATWQRIEIEPIDPALDGAWSAHVLLDRPVVPDWSAVADVLARQAAVGFGRVVSREALTRHEQQQRALVESGKALSTERTLDGVLRRIIEHAMELTGARYGALGVLGGDGTTLTRFITVGIDEPTAARIGELPRGRGILGVLIDDPQPLRLRRLQDDARSVGFPAHHPPMETFLGVPIITSGEVAGRIYLTEKQGAPEFSSEDVELVETLASQAAIAIDNAALNEQLQRTAAQLAEAGRHKSAFLANMSHELRSPLNTILGYVQLLLEDPRALDEEQLEDLRIVRGSSEHLLALITDLLDLQRIEAGRIELVRAGTDIGALVESAVASVRPSIAGTVTLSLDLGALRDPMLEIDPTRVRQVLLNVLGNAAKFTDQGEIAVRVMDDAEVITIEVRDTGPGIPEAEQARIFESFYQSQAAIARTPGAREGAGLGLAITRLLVELHGGRVSLASRDGDGTTVTIELPRSASNEEVRP